MIKEAYGDAAASRSTEFEWHKLFREGRDLVEDDHCVDRPSTSRTDDYVAKVKALLNSDRRLPIRLVSDILGMSYGNVQRIITEDLGMRKICAKLVPKVLSEDQMATGDRRGGHLQRGPSPPGTICATQIQSSD